MAEGIYRTCRECYAQFAVKFPSDRMIYCGYSCSNKVTSRNRSLGGEKNPNWRGGKSTHPLRHIYLQMVSRCHSPDHPRYVDYGGRGIEVCDRWRNDFWAFVADMGERPEGLTLERVDNDGGYNPDNCRWATYSEQSKNRRASAYAGSKRHPETGRFMPKEAS